MVPIADCVPLKVVIISFPPSYLPSTLRLPTIDGSVGKPHNQQRTETRRRGDNDSQRNDSSYRHCATPSQFDSQAACDACKVSPWAEQSARGCGTRAGATQEATGDAIRGRKMNQQRAAASVYGSCADHIGSLSPLLEGDHKLR